MLDHWSVTIHHHKLCPLLPSSSGGSWTAALRARDWPPGIHQLLFQLLDAFFGLANCRTRVMVVASHSWVESNHSRNQELVFMMSLLMVWFVDGLIMFNLLIIILICWRCALTALWWFNIAGKLTNDIDVFQVGLSIIWLFSSHVRSLEGMYDHDGSWWMLDC